MKTSQLTDSSIISRTKDIMFSNLDGEILGIDSFAGYFYSMNGTAHHIWELLAVPAELGEIVAQCCTKFEVEADVCRTDILSLLSELHNAGLIKIQDA